PKRSRLKMSSQVQNTRRCSDSPRRDPTSATDSHDGEFARFRRVPRLAPAAGVIFAIRHESDSHTLSPLTKGRCLAEPHRHIRWWAHPVPLFAGQPYTG